MGKQAGPARPKEVRAAAGGGAGRGAGWGPSCRLAPLRSAEGAVGFPAAELEDGELPEEAASTLTHAAQLFLAPPFIFLALGADAGLPVPGTSVPSKGLLSPEESLRASSLRATVGRAGALGEPRVLGSARAGGLRLWGQLLPTQSPVQLPQVGRSRGRAAERPRHPGSVRSPQRAPRWPHSTRGGLRKPRVGHRDGRETAASGLCAGAGSTVARSAEAVPRRRSLHLPPSTASPPPGFWPVTRLPRKGDSAFVLGEPRRARPLRRLAGGTPLLGFAYSGTKMTQPCVGRLPALHLA